MCDVSTCFYKSYHVLVVADPKYVNLLSFWIIGTMKNIFHTDVCNFANNSLSNCFREMFVVCEC